MDQEYSGPVALLGGALWHQRCPHHQRMPTPSEVEQYKKKFDFFDEARSTV